MIEFEVDGIPFELKRLDVDASCAGLEVLARALGPAASRLMLEGGEPDYASLLTALLSGAGHIPALLRVFQDVTRVARHGDGRFAQGGAMMPLKPWVQDVFRGRIDRMIAFLVHAVRAEYGGFLGSLASGGGALAGLLPAKP